MCWNLFQNVIMHGLSGIDRKGIVGIVVKKKMNNLEITIYDNGRGMEADDLNELRRKLESGNKPEQFSSIGIQNVHNRLQLLFGVEYGLQVSSQKSMGTVVKIVIPALSLEEMNQYVQVVDSR